MGVITNLSLGAGTINYVSADGGAESGTGTWVTYNDGASATPLDAVGGLASLVTLTTDNVTPLRGSQSLVLNKLAGNAQGQGISIPFTIDTADLAKPLHISFDYALTSATGTYADGRLQVYLLETHFSDLVTTGTVLDTAPPSGSNTVITSLGSTANLYSGWRVSGVGVPTGTTVVSVGVGTVTVSKAITIGAGITFTFSPPIIQPAGYTVMAGAQGIQLKHSGCTFQTSSTIKNYQLCIHVASTDTTAYSLELDNVEVGPERAAYGVPVTDWQSYTPTFNSGFSVGTGGFATNNWKYRRVGDSIEVKGRVVFGTAGNSMGSGNFTVSIPPGLSIDINKLDTVASGNTYGSAGVAWAYDSGGTTQREVYYVTRSDTSLTSVQVEGRTDAGVPGAWTSAFPFTWGSTDTLVIIFTLPISGWSSNTVMSQDTDTRVVAFGRYGTPTSALTASSTTVIFGGTTVSDTHSSYNSATGVYTVPVSGFYNVSWGLVSTGTYSGAIMMYSELYKNLASVSAVQSPGVSNVAVANGSVQGVFCNAGDTLYIKAQSNATTPAYGGNSQLVYFTATRQSGPATIAASETVAMRRNSTSGQTINSAVTSIVNFETAGFDTHSAWRSASGAYNAATGTWATTNPGFVAPVSGVYLVAGCIGFDATSAFFTTVAYNIIRVNGTGIFTSSDFFTANGTIKISSFSGLVRCLAGDVIDVTCRQETGAARNLQPYTSDRTCLTIVRVGN